MVDIQKYICQLIDLLKMEFGARLLYVGLQGSHLRGEAHENSDIDIMVIIDELGVADLAAYRSIIQSMDHFELSCGFICSREDLAHWNPLEIWNLANGTKDYHGSLRDFIPTYTEQDLRNFVKLSVNNLYHGICHHYIHADCNKDIAELSGAYKGVFFILQSLHYLALGEAVGTKKELLLRLDGKNHAVLKRSMELNQGIAHDFDSSFELLFTWCQEILKSV